MTTNIVFTLTGPDRIGIVEDVTGVLLGLDGNVSTSRMTRLGGEFAILMLVALPEERLDGFDAAFSALVEEGYALSAKRTDPTLGESHIGWLPYRIEVSGADHEGIVHEIAHGLSQQGINIESAETSTTEAPVSGTTLFSMSALVLVPPALSGSDWLAALRDAGEQANVEIEVSPAG